MCGVGVGEEVFVMVLLGGTVFIAWVDLYVNFVGGISGSVSSDVYFLDNRLRLKDGVCVGENSSEA